jgi:exosortase
MESTRTVQAVDVSKDRSLMDEVLAVWGKLENKEVFVVLVAAWLALFHFLGNSTFGYINSPSMFGWVLSIYDTTPDDSHGRLIPFAVLVLLWLKREELLAIPQSLWPPGLLLLAGCAFLHWTGYLFQQTRVSAAAFFLGLYSIFGLTWGRRWMRASLFPFVLFAFCIPITAWVDPVTVPLRMFATSVTHFICHGLLGLNVVRHGTQLSDAASGMDFDVVAACSGIRSILALTALTSIYSMLAFRSTWRRWVVFSSSIPISLLCNIIRLVCVILAADFFGREAGLFVHEWFGFVTYAIAIVLVLGLAGLLKESAPAAPPASPAP